MSNRPTQRHPRSSYADETESKSDKMSAPPTANLPTISSNPPKERLISKFKARIKEKYKATKNAKIRLPFRLSVTKDKAKLKENEDSAKQLNNKLEELQELEENNRLQEENNRLREENNRLREENSRLKGVKEENNQLKEQLKEADEVIRDTEGKNKRLNADLTKTKKKMENLLREIADSRHLKDTPVPKIVTGIYESGGTNPRTIQDDWYWVHKKLRKYCFDSFKQLKHLPQDSIALTEYKKLTKDLSGTPDVKGLPRIETTIAVRRISVLLMRIFGLLDLVENTKINFAMASKMPQASDKQSEDILRKLPRPDLDTTSFKLIQAIDTLSECGNYGSECVEFLKSEQHHIENCLKRYNISSKVIPDFASRLTYACIYIKLQMQSIGGNDIAGYIAGTTGDYNDFYLGSNKSIKPSIPDRVLFDEELHFLDFETESTETHTVLFTTFPGIGYRDSNSSLIISKCKIAT